MGAVVANARVWADMVKLSHSVFALPFALIATFLAGRHLPAHRPDWGQIALILVCMVAARSVAMTFNRIVDAAIDGRNPRTAARALPAGRLTLRAAYVFLFAGSAVFVGSCLAFHRLFGNSWPLLLAAPILLYICGYSYSKRFTRWSHFYLGSAIGLSPLAAWVAIDPSSLGWPALLLGAAVTLWVGGFDIIYACQDIELDRREGLFSLPSRLGPARALMIARACHGVVVVLLAVLAVVAGLNWLFATGVAVVAVLLLIENSLVKPNDFSKVNLAFFTINGIVSVLMGILAILDVLLLSPIAPVHSA